MGSYVCCVCGRAFTGYRHKPDGPVMCSRACFDLHHAAPSFTCATCGRVFKRKGRPKSGARAFCSPACAYRSFRLDPDTTVHKVRNGSAYRKWKCAVLKRDGSRCQQCGAEEGLHAHHIQAWRDYPDLRYDVANGRTLCSNCHSTVHGLALNPAGRARKECEHCGTTIRGRAGYTRCRSCAAKYSPKAIAAREALAPYAFRAGVPSPRWKRSPAALTPSLR